MPMLRRHHKRLLSQGLLTQDQAAEDVCKMSVRWLQHLRANGEGPPHVVVSTRYIGYEPDALQAWMQSRKSA
jgi:hypothetical protein